MTTTIKDGEETLGELFVAMPERPCDLESLAPDRLPAFARVLLITDGTVTHMLRAHFREPINVEVRDHTFETLTSPMTWLDADAGEDILIRKVALIGATSGALYAEATSHILLARLNDGMRADIVEMRRSIGHVLLANFSENRRELLWFGARENAAGPPSLERAYRVISRQKPLMIITETFAPEISTPGKSS